MNRPEVTINGIDLFETYKAPIMEKHSVQPPVLKSYYQDIPGGDGSADLSEVLSGRPTYERREITMHFNSEQPGNQWPTIFSKILRDFHGKEGKIIFGDDPDYYYIGRMSVADYELNSEVGMFTISANAEPYKYELLSSLEPWLWDPFNFVTGVIRKYGNIRVDGSYTLTFPGTTKWIIPEFITSGNVSVTFGGKTYQLANGRSKIYDIVIKAGNHELIFTGSGTVSVEYRGGIL